MNVVQIILVGKGNVRLAMRGIQLQKFVLQLRLLPVMSALVDLLVMQKALAEFKNYLTLVLKHYPDFRQDLKSLTVY